MTYAAVIRFINKRMKFSKFSHEKTSTTIEGRMSHFQRLRNRHTTNSFVIVGPNNHCFSGGLAIEFQSIYQKIKSKDLEQPIVLDVSEVQREISIIGEKTEIQQHQIQSNKKSFDRIITNAPIIKQTTTEVIELLDSPQLQAPEDVYLHLPIPPIFNIDGLHYTPTFVLPRAKIDEPQCFVQFTKKIEDSKKQIEADEIMEPRPRSKHLYCGICKDYYEEYLGHIKGRTHFDSSRRSSFAQQIKTLQLQMNIGSDKKQREKEIKKIKVKEDRMKKKEEDALKEAIKKVSEDEEKKRQEEKRKSKDAKKKERKEKETEILMKKLVKQQEKSVKYQEQKEQLKQKSKRKKGIKKAQSSQQSQQTSSQESNSSSSIKKTSYKKSKARSRQKPKPKKIEKKKTTTAKINDGKRKKRGRKSKAQLAEIQLQKYLQQKRLNQKRQEQQEGV